MRDRETDAYVLRSSVRNFTVDEMVYRVYVSSSRKVVRTGPFEIIVKQSTNTYKLDGIDYPVPDNKTPSSCGTPSEFTINRTRDHQDIIDFPNDTGKGW